MMATSYWIRLKGATIEVSYVGYAPKRIQVTESKAYAIILKEDAKLLDEVIVTGYGAVSKKKSDDFYC